MAVVEHLFFFADARFVFLLLTLLFVVQGGFEKMWSKMAENARKWLKMAKNGKEMTEKTKK